MTHDKKQGALICTIALTLALIVLILSSGWGTPLPLTLFIFSWEWTGPITETRCEKYGPGLNCLIYGATQTVERTRDIYFTIHTKYVISFLIAVFGYGGLRLASVVPDLFETLRLKLNGKNSSDT